MVTQPRPELSLSDWAVLAVVAQGPTHGWPVVRELRSDGSFGRVWTVPRAAVYRSLTTLTGRGLVEECGESEHSQGPQRVMVRATRTGRAALRRWLATPVDHVRDVRTELLLKLAVSDRAGLPTQDLVRRQLDELAPVLRAVSAPPSEEGFDRTLGRWRREQALAVERFLQGLVSNDRPGRTRHRQASSD
ncbi:MAG: helix-turn-helix transcriptional regulator [Acidimicrobiia bacterium]